MSGMTREEAIRILERRSTIPDEEASWLDIMQAIDMAIEALKEQRPHGECKVYHAMFEDRIACKCGYMNVITGKWNDYNYCPRCGRMAQKEGDE